MGPHTFNFAEAAEHALAVGAAWRVADLAVSVNLAFQLLDQAQRLQDARSAAVRFSLLHQGAVAKTVESLALLVKPSAGKKAIP